MTADPLVQDYLGRLEAAAWPLSADRRTELLQEVREHIEDALSVEGGRDETTVRNVLDRLGRPEEIVSTEVDGAPPAAGAAVIREAAATLSTGADHERFGGVEIIALLLISFGAFVVPVVGPLPGLFFVWASNRWTTHNKIVATALVVLLVALPLLLVFVVALGRLQPMGASAQPMGAFP
ncbi:MAG TPA: hypothetical protein VFW92_10150 [Candidatus Limnocylindrales bacterium]|nr:hypothetical protein [Candidatus Limnocylindrales bacterium]